MVCVVCLTMFLEHHIGMHIMGFLPYTQNCGYACAGNPRNVFPVTDPGMHHDTCVTHVPSVMHVGIANPLWRGKRPRHYRRTCIPQLCVSGKRPMITGQHSTLTSYHRRSSIWTCWLLLNNWLVFKLSLFVGEINISLGALYQYVDPGLKTYTEGPFLSFKCIYWNYFTNKLTTFLLNIAGTCYLI